jgi:hypothetical protein
MPEEKKKDDDEEVGDPEDGGADEEVDFLGKAPKKKDTRITFRDAPLSKPTKKFGQDEKKENELLRQFRIKISNIEITNDRKEVIDPFIRFIIGGDYYTLIKKRGKEDIVLHYGELGKVHTTDVIKFVEGD